MTIPVGTKVDTTTRLREYVVTDLKVSGAVVLICRGEQGCGSLVPSMLLHVHNDFHERLLPNSDPRQPTRKEVRR